MFGSDYLIGYSQGRSSAEDERETEELVARVIYGRRPVQVEQSYLNQLTSLVETLRSTSDHNLGKARIAAQKTPVKRGVHHPHRSLLEGGAIPLLAVAEAGLCLFLRGRILQSAE